LAAGKEMSTTMAFVRMLTNLLKDKALGPRIVPIVADEARTFGMANLFKQIGIYSSVGQRYEPEDIGSILSYREATDGQILEEGISEASAISSWVAAATSYSAHGLRMLPFYIYYSMFGFQRVGDLIWAACDAQAKGFLIGATAGRTTLAGEGLQHQDGHSHVLALPSTRIKAYDPAYAYELATIVHDGITRMYCNGEAWIYYLTVMNEPYRQPAMPKGDHVQEGILKGMYRYLASEMPAKKAKGRAHLLGSGAILNEAIKAQAILEERYGVAADVWSVTSYKQLYHDAVDSERYHMLNPGETRRPYVETLLAKEKGVFVAASDYLRVLPASIARWFPGPLHVLGTDGFGRSDGRAQLRDFFEVDARYIALAALHELAREGQIDLAVARKAVKDLDIDPGKLNPLVD
jgi:pyruvate dehydrogenase E1 component